MWYHLPLKRRNVFCFVERVWATCSKGQTTLMAKTTTDIQTKMHLFLNSLAILFQMCQLDWSMTILLGSTAAQMYVLPSRVKNGIKQTLSLKCLPGYHGNKQCMSSDSSSVCQVIPVMHVRWVQQFMSGDSSDVCRVTLVVSVRWFKQCLSGDSSDVRQLILAIYVRWSGDSSNVYQAILVMYVMWF